MRDLTSKAIAYLKADLSQSTRAEPAVVLPEEDMPVLRDFTSGLCVSYVVDTGGSFEYIQYRDLHKESVSLAELHETGIANLGVFVANGHVRIQPHNEIFAVFVDGNFEASMLILDWLWDDCLRDFCKGDFLAALPTRDVLAFCDASSVKGRSELISIIETLRGSMDHPLSHSLYRRRDNKWGIEASL